MGIKQVCICKAQSKHYLSVLQAKNSRGISLILMLSFTSSIFSNRKNNTVSGTVRVLPSVGGLDRSLMP